MAEIKVGCFGSVNHRATTNGQERIKITLLGKVNGSLETGENKGKQKIRNTDNNQPENKIGL